MPLSLSKQTTAEQDLIDIWLYTYQEWGEEQADHYLEQIENGLLRLVENPNLGIDCSYIRDGYRRFPLLHHKVYYRLTDHSIEIIRLLHERMDEDRNSI